MLPRLVFGLSQGQVVWEEEGEGHPCLVSKEEEEPQTEQLCKIFYVQAWLIRNPAWSPPPSLISSYTRKGCWAIGRGHCFRSGVRLTFLCSILGLPACRHLVGITMSGKLGCSLRSALRMLCSESGEASSAELALPPCLAFQASPSLRAAWLLLRRLC